MAAKLIDVRRKSKSGVLPVEYQVEVVKGKSISILKDGVLCNTFLVGDQAEYDSYNLSYYGPITSISETTVCVANGPKTRAFMDFYKFCWRNVNFDLERAIAENSNTMTYI